MTYDEIKNDPAVRIYVKAADATLSELGLTGEAV